MKNYLAFNLTGKKLLPIWLLFLLLFIAPYTIIILKLQTIQAEGGNYLFIFPLFLCMIVISFIVTFYIAKMTIENIVYKDKNIVFNGSFGKYLGIVLLGFFLTIITLGIYAAWFIRNFHRFFVDNSSYDSQSFKFNGKGGVLFLIFLLTLMIPTIILSIVMAGFILSNPDQSSSTTLIFQLIIFVILIPYMYFIYKWMVDINFRDYKISWETNFWNSCGKIALEMLLTLITAGLYMPLAVLRLFEYFTARTTAIDKENKQKFGYNIEHLNDFLFIWGQILLTIVTVGVYYSWAYCKINKRILGKTYLERVSSI